MRQLVVGALGWLLWAGLIVWLAFHASADALDVATFLATVVVTVALLAVLTALALRPAVMRQRAQVPAHRGRGRRAAGSRLGPGRGDHGGGGRRSPRYASVEEARR